MAQTLLGRNIVFPIYNEDGTPFHDLVMTKTTVESVVMSLGDNITGDIYYKDDSLNFTMKEYIEFKNNPDDETEVPVKYTIVNPPTVIREGLVEDNSELKGMTKYSLAFYHPMYALGSIPFTDVAVTSDERKYLSQNKTFSWIGNLFEFVDKLNANLLNTQWHVSVNIAQYEEDGVTETSMWQKAMTTSEVLPFDKQMISDALKTAYDTWEIPFIISEYENNDEVYWYKYSDDGATFTPVNQAILDQVPREGRNLLLGSNVQHSNSDYLLASYDFGQLKPLQGETVTITIHGRLGSGRDYFRVYNSTASCLIKTMILDTEVEQGRTWSGDVVWSTTDSRGQQVANDKVLIYQYPSSASGTSTIEWIKIEFGSSRTTYTLAPEETLIGTTKGHYVGIANKTIYSEMPLNFSDYNWSNYHPFDISFGAASKPILDEQGNEFIFRMGQGLGLKNNSRTPRNNKIITRIVGSGSERNIPYGYPQIRWYGNPDWDWTKYDDTVYKNTTSLDDFTDWIDVEVEDSHVAEKREVLLEFHSAVATMLSSGERGDIKKGSQSVGEYTYDWSVLSHGTYVSVRYSDNIYAVAYTNDISTNGGNVVDLDSSTPSEDAYPIYKGIVGGEYVQLIKHPFTRKTLMPTAYTNSVFNKVSPYSSDGTANINYNPNTEIIDYIDADNSYPNPINPLAPSVEIHQFDEVYPRLGDKYLVSVNPYEEWEGMSSLEYINYAQQLMLSVNSWEVHCLNRSIVYLSANEDVNWEHKGGSSTESLTMKRHTYNEGDVWWKITIKSPNINFTTNVYMGLYSPNVYVEWDDTMDDDGNYLQSYFKMTLPQLDFDLYACAAITEEMQINMRSGACMGCTFTIHVDWDDYKANFYNSDGEFDPVIHTQTGDGHVRDGNKYPDSSQGQISVIVAKDLETFGTLMPNRYQQPVSGDKFVILGISLPLSYITNAQTELDETMGEYMLENNIAYYDYPIKVDEYFLAKHTNILLQIRNNSIFRFQYRGVLMALSIKQIVIQYGDGILPRYDITLTDDIEVVLNQIGQVTDDVSKMRMQLSELQKYYSENLIEEINSRLSRIVDDVCMGRITFQNGLDSIGKVVLSDDIRSNDFVSGLYGGRGWTIDKLGNAEFESARVRSYLEVVQLLINRMQGQEGDTIFTDNDQIEKVDVVTNGGNTSYILSLKEKFEGYVTGQMEGNIIKGIINTLAAKESGISDESTNNPDKQGSDEGGNKYYTSWMRVVESHGTSGTTLGVNQIRVVLYGDNEVPSRKNFAPCELMTIARWGCALDPNEQGISAAEKASRTHRQQTFFISTSEGRLMKLSHVNSPILRDTNYGTTLGTIPDFINNWSIANRLIDGRDYLYAQGVIVGDFIKVDINGDPLVEYVDCGEWVNGSTGTPTVGHGIYLHNEKNEATLQYETHDVWHNNAKWRCLQHQPVTSGGVTTYYEPTEANSDYWEKLEEARTVKTTTIYTSSDEQPATPSDTSVPPSGWALVPPVVPTATISGGFTNVTSGTYSGWRKAEGNNVSGAWIKDTITFNANAGDIVQIEIATSCEEYYDGIIVGYPNQTYVNGDSDFHDGKTVEEALNDDDAHCASGEGHKFVNLFIVTTGQQSVEIIYMKDDDTDTNEDCGWYRIVQNPKVWASIGTLINNVLDGTWSTPTRWNGDDGKNSSEVQPNILLRTSYDNGIDKVKEKWDGQWDYISIDTNADTEVLGRKSLRLNAQNRQSGVIFSQNVLGKIKPNTYYTVSFNAFRSVGGVFAVSFYNLVNGVRTNLFDGDVIVDGVSRTITDGNCDIYIGGTWDGARHTITFKTGSASVISTSNLSFIFYQAYSVNGATVHSQTCICMPKLEEGQVATAYMSNEDDLKGATGERGKVGRFFYYGGEFDVNDEQQHFVVNDAQAPYFKTGANMYHVYNGNNGSYTMHDMGNNFNAEPWVIMTNDFKYIITEAIFGSYAHFGSFIINGDWLISQHGMLDDVESTNYMLFDVNFVNGNKIVFGESVSNSYKNVGSATFIGGKTYQIRLVGDNFYDYDTQTIGGVLNCRMYDGSSEIGSTIQLSPSSSTSVLSFTPSTTGVYYLRCNMNSSDTSANISASVANVFVPHFAIDAMQGTSYQHKANISGSFETENKAYGNKIVLDVDNGGFNMIGPVAVRDDNTGLPRDSRREKLFSVSYETDWDTLTRFALMKLLNGNGYGITFNPLKGFVHQFSDSSVSLDCNELVFEEGLTRTSEHTKELRFNWDGIHFAIDNDIFQMSWRELLVKKTQYVTISRTTITTIDLTKGLTVIPTLEIGYTSGLLKIPSYTDACAMFGLYVGENLNYRIVIISKPANGTILLSNSDNYNFYSNGSSSGTTLISINGATICELEVVCNSTSGYIIYK